MPRRRVSRQSSQSLAVVFCRAAFVHRRAARRARCPVGAPRICIRARHYYGGYLALWADASGADPGAGLVRRRAVSSSIA